MSRAELGDVLVVLRKELRETLRDRRTLAIMILFPLVVYPVVSLLTAQVMAGKQTSGEARRSRIALVSDGSPAAARAIADIDRRLAAPSNKIEVVRPPATSHPGEGRATVADVAAGRLDAMLEVRSRPPDHGPGSGDAAVRIVYDETRDSSEKAHARVEGMLSSVLPAGCARTYAVTSSSVAPETRVGGYVLSKILPLIVVVMTMLGAFYPAIDITAGERERGTLETLLASPIRRVHLMTGKVLAVATLATLTGALNIGSMSLTVAEAARLAGGSQALTIPWARAAATLLTVVPAAFLFGAIMVAIGAMARSFKEAQSLLTPVYFLCFTPALLASLADFRLAGLALVVPGTNLTLLARDLMLGEATVAHAAVVLLSTAFAGWLALVFAARLYDSERLLAATDSELVALRAWIRYLLGRGPATAGASWRASDPSDPAAAAPSAGHAIALFAVAFVLWFFVFTRLQRWSLVGGVLVSQWGGFLGLVLVYARAVRVPLPELLALRRPSGWALGGATLIGASGWVILGVVADRLMPPPRALVDEMRKLIRPAGEHRPLALSLATLALTPAVCEEALFRGPILRGLRRRFTVATACASTGVLFGVLHGDIWRFIPTSLLGALLSWVALTSGSILPSMLIHFVNNGALVVLGYAGLDQAGEALSAPSEIALLGAAAVTFTAGVACVRRGRIPSEGAHLP